MLYNIDAIRHLTLVFSLTYILFIVSIQLFAAKPNNNSNNNYYFMVVVQVYFASVLNVDCN